MIDFFSRQQPKPIWNPLINPDDTIVLYQILETGTSNRTNIGRDQLLKF